MERKDFLGSLGAGAAFVLTFPCLQGCSNDENPGNKDIFANARILTFGLKTIDLRFNQYDRSDGLNAYIITLGTTFVGN